MSVTVKLDMRRMDEIIRNTPYHTQQVINRMAFQIEARAKDLAPVKTGALASSIYVNTKGGKASMAGMFGALDKNPNVTLAPLPEPGSPFGAVIGPSVDYAIYVEMGTYKMGARPYLYPALQSVAWLFNAGETWRELIS